MAAGWLASHETRGGVGMPTPSPRAPPWPWPGLGGCTWVGGGRGGWGSGVHSAYLFIRVFRVPGQTPPRKRRGEGGGQAGEPMSPPPAGGGRLERESGWRGWG